MRVVELERGIARLALDFKEEMLGDPRLGLIHTGVITTLIDTTCGFAVMSSLDQPSAIATLDLRMDYLRPAVRDRILYAQAECYRKTKHIIFIRAHAWQESEETLVATSSSAFMCQSRRAAPVQAES